MDEMAMPCRRDGVSRQGQPRVDCVMSPKCVALFQIMLNEAMEIASSSSHSIREKPSANIEQTFLFRVSSLGIRNEHYLEGLNF